MTQDVAVRLPAFLEHLSRAALVDAARLVGELAASGTPVARIVDELLVPAQVEVGRRWASARWTVAQEHAATAIIETVLTTASVRAHVPDPGEDAPSLVLVCAEGEWHALAARMAAESLKSEGVAVTFLGPSLPAEVLPEFLKETAPTALGVSCSLSFALPGALRCTEAAHEADVPVIAAGRGYGPDAARAERLGMDGWAATVADGAALLREWVSAPPPRREALLPASDEWRRLEPEDRVGPSLRRLLARRPRLQSFSPALVDRLRKDLHYALRYGAAAHLVGDVAVLRDHAAWLADVLAARGVPRDLVADVHVAVAEELEGDLPETAALFREVAEGVARR